MMKPKHVEVYRESGTVPYENEDTLGNMNIKSLTSVIWLLHAVLWLYHTLAHSLDLCPDWEYKLEPYPSLFNIVTAFPILLMAMALSQENALLMVPFMVQECVKIVLFIASLSQLPIFDLSVRMPRFAILFYALFLLCSLKKTVECFFAFRHAHNVYRNTGERKRRNSISAFTNAAYEAFGTPPNKCEVLEKSRGGMPSPCTPDDSIFAEYGDAVLTGDDSVY